MNYYLAKTEPHTYSIDQFRSDVKTFWDGVTNPQAVRAIRQMRPRDRVFIYHSGSEPAVVGLATVTAEPEPDPKLARSWRVELRYDTHLEPPTPLSAIKQDGRFGEWALVRQGRLSTMEAPPEFVDWMRGRYPAVRF